MSSEANMIASGLAGQMTPDQVERWAFQEGHSLLYAACTIYRRGQVSWQEAMQIAAISAVASLKEATRANVEMRRMSASPIAVIGR